MSVTPKSSSQSANHAVPAPGPTGDLEELAARMLEEMTERWRRGERPRAEEFLDRQPELWNSASAVMDLIYEEMCLRHEYGETVDREEIVQRFPRWKQQIDILLGCIDTLQDPGGFPHVGETCGEFQLLAELGRGGQGCVFVATQSSLGDRPVVLKITPRRGDEHLSLARLQHTHIVPLLSVLDEPDRNLRVLCMPYFGGLTLAAILDGMHDSPQDQRSGRQILEVLNKARAEAPVHLPPGRDPAAPFLQRASYAQAICWIGACLAEALKYAHDRGLLHLDLKPSNVLLTASCQPMLLDFHLAREPLYPGDCGTNFGGTRSFMSPEQARAMNAIKAGDMIADTVDGRSDVYSLGLVLHQALASPVHCEQKSPTPQRGEITQPCSVDATKALRPIRLPALHRCNPSVPIGLSDIVAKCLAPEARMRYQSASALAADLWAHLNDLPLKGVANRSITERWRKWRRRKPHLLSLVGMLAAVLVISLAAVGLAVLHGSHRVEEARTALADGQNLLKKNNFADAASSFKRGISQLENLPGNHDLRQKLQECMRQAVRSQLAEELHDIADRFRLLYGADSLPAARREVLQAPCREFWNKREQILAHLGRELEPDIEQRVQQDLLDLAILGADLRVQLAKKGDLAAARREALQMLDQAEAMFGPNAVLYHERQQHAEALGDLQLAQEAGQHLAECPPRTAWEHYALGRALMNMDQLEAAADHFDQAVTLQPNGLWPSFYQGICCYRLGRFEDSALAFTTCTTLAPQVAGCFHNRALAFVGLGRFDRALLDFDRALALDPGLAEAALNRGLLHLHEKHLAAAAADFQYALDHGADSARAHFHLAQACLARGDRPAALSHLERCRQIDPNHLEATQLWKTLHDQR